MVSIGTKNICQHFLYLRCSQLGLLCSLKVILLLVYIDIVLITQKMSSARSEIQGSTSAILRGRTYLHKAHQIQLVLAYNITLLKFSMSLRTRHLSLMGYRKGGLDIDISIPSRDQKCLGLSEIGSVRQVSRAG